MSPVKAQCPACSVTLKRYEWSRLWWLSAGMSGRLVQPCSRCGALLRLSAMRVFTALGALGLLGTAVARFMGESEALLPLALMFAVLTWVGFASTRIHLVQQLAADGDDHLTSPSASTASSSVRDERASTREFV